ncbi:hypothetical protein DF048_04315 [Burkholderia seminalis]|nr:hypothetical protein DF048_04315 [Burkholderia seminalis]
MHRRSPCRCTFCSRQPLSRRRPARRRTRRSGDYRRAKKTAAPPVTGARRSGPRQAGTAASLAGSLTAA